MRGDQLGEAARGDDRRRLVAELGSDSLDDAVDLACEAVDQAGPQRRFGRLPDRGLGRDEVDLDEAGGAFEQRIHRDLDPRRENTADVLPRDRDDVEVRRRAEIDDDRGRAVTLPGRNRVRDPVGADLAWVVVTDRDSSFRPRPENE